MGIALAEVPSVVADLSANLSTVDSVVFHACAKAQTASVPLSVVVFPELFLSGYDAPRETLAAMAQPLCRCHDQGRVPHADCVAHPAVAALRDMAVRHGVDIVAGLPTTLCAATAATLPVDVSSPSVYNTAVWVACAPVDALSDGVDPGLLLAYDKQHLWGDNERAAFRAGPALPDRDVRAWCPTVVARHGLAFGLLVCYDSEFPEPTRRLALGPNRRAGPGAASGATDGAPVDVVVIITACASPQSPQLRIVPVRAAENSISAVQVNHPPPRFGGHSQCVGPDFCSTVRLATQWPPPTSGASERPPTPSEGSGSVLLAEVRRRRVVGGNPYIADRRPELYSAA